MKNNDVALIQRILADDESAFAELVMKHQKAVHALAWRKIGDFHIAEDITQDAFLKVYQRLHTLKDPNLFSGWLYVITSRLCDTWLRKKRIQTEPLEDVEPTMTQKDAYSQHVVKEHAYTAAEAQRQVVKKLLAKLKESERTVMTLHYLGEMKVEEISRFLGVSASTIKSRLRRARNRLQKEETMIREALEHFQISPNLSDNIMQEISRIKPAAPAGSKPLVPWAVAASSAILIVLLLGLGSQQLGHFQQPYSLDAQAETTVELVDAPIVLNLEVKTDVQNQLGSSNVLGVSKNDGQKPDEVVLAGAETGADEKLSEPKQQWIQRNAPVGSGHNITLFQTQEGGIYFFTDGRGGKLYKMHAERNEWKQVSDLTPLQAEDFNKFVMVNDTLYVVFTRYLQSHKAGDYSRIYSPEIYCSKDGGETWVSVCKCPDGWVVGFEVIDDRFYLAIEDQIFVSKDTGKTWSNLDLDVKFTGEVYTLKVIQNMLLAATNRGLYHIDGDSWQRLLPIDEAKKVTSITGTENNLYVLSEWDWENVGPQEQNDELPERTWWLFWSTDKGQSWTDITPTNASSIMGAEPFEDLPQATLVAVKNTVLLIGWNGAAVVRSVNNGDTWTVKKTSNIPLMPYSVHNAAAVDENTFYLQGYSGMYQSIDGGISWTRLDQEVGGSINDLICFSTSKVRNTSGTLYAMFTGGIYNKPGGINDRWVFQSSDKGNSWHVVNPEIQPKKKIPFFTRIVKSGGVLYAKSRGPTNWAITGVSIISEDGNTLIPIKGMPTFNAAQLDDLLRRRKGSLSDLSNKLFIEMMQESCVGATQFFKQLAQLGKNRHPYADILQESGLNGAFAVSGNTFYMEYNFKLFRWELGDTEWSDIGQEETAFLPINTLTFKTMIKDLQLAVSGDTVYVGKRDGHLIVSLDRGNNWIDLTLVLPFKVKVFNDILIVEDMVYIATDAGVAASDQENNWDVITDADGTNLKMDILTADGTKLYGVIKDTGIYRLDSRLWKKIISDIPDNITSLAVDGDTLYVGTQKQGMLHFTLEE